MKVSIVIPAYNEEKRIGSTLESYLTFFCSLQQKNQIDFEVVAALNGCKDTTLAIAQAAQKKFGNMYILDIPEAGKGLAIIEGFKNSLTRNNDLIGFVDADMATSPEAFYDLINAIHHHDGVIASRYLPGAHVYPREVMTKVIGSRFFNLMLRTLFSFEYKDTQCGAKIFRAEVIDKVTPHLTDTQWAFDVDLLFWCKRHKFSIKEVPTVWSDKKFSKLNIMGGGLGMMKSILKLWFRHSRFKRMLVISK